jgi:hypothetical protein
LCRNSRDEIASCSSSARYKDAIAPLAVGLNVISRLRPVSFEWKGSRARDLGFVAEHVAVIEPLLVTRNDEAQIEGVKYRQLTALLVKAIQQQQEQIRALQEEVSALRESSGRSGALE